MTTVTEALALAVAHHQAKRFADAEFIYRRILEAQPDNTDAIHLLGLLAADTGDIGKGIELVGQAVGLRPDVEAYRFNLGNLRLAADDLAAAIGCYRAVLRINPRSVDAARNLGVAMTRLASDAEAAERLRPPSHARSGTRYHVIRPWGFGFFGEFNHVVVQLLFAEREGRIPFVLWNADCRYHVPGTENAWNTFFLPVSDARLEHVQQAGLSCFPGSWTPETLAEPRFKPMQRPADLNPYGISALAAVGRDESITVGDGYNELHEILAWAPANRLATMAEPADICRDLIARRIKPRPEIASEIDRLALDILRHGPVIAVHHRSQNSFKVAESLEREPVTIARYFAEVDRYLAVDAARRVFLLTDLDETVEQFRGRYGSRLTVLDRVRLAKQDDVDVGLDLTNDGYRLGREVMIDAYLAARCDAFLGDGASGVSCTIAVLKDWQPGSLTLLRENVFLRRGRKSAGPERAK